MYDYNLYNYFTVHDDSNSSSDDDATSAKKDKKEKKSIKKKLEAKARSYGMTAQTAQLKLAVAKRKAKGPTMVAAHHEAKVLKQIKASTNANLNSIGISGEYTFVV